MNRSFHNASAVHLDEDNPRSLPLDSFPTFDDVSIELLEVLEADEVEDGRELAFVSAEHGRLAGFPYWEHPERDLRHLVPSDVPVGPIDNPFDERDEDWRIVIFAHAGFIYLLEADAPGTSEFRTWFRIPQGNYLNAWRLVIEAFNPAPSLDDIFTQSSQPN